MAALGAAKTQKTLGWIAMKLNDVVGINLHVIPKITNEIATKTTSCFTTASCQPSTVSRPHVQGAW